MNDDDTASERSRQARPDPLGSLLLREPQPLGAGSGAPMPGTFAGASAERALAAVFSTVARLVGDEAFGSLARACWRAYPATVGDPARFAAALPAFILAEVPFPDVPALADCARLDWAMAEAERAADVEPRLQSFSLLAQFEPDGLELVGAPGLAVVRSGHPVVDIRQALSSHDHRPAAASDALIHRRGQIALVWRHGWRARTQAVAFSDARWCEALAGGLNLGLALQTASEQGEELAFEPWLLQALHQRWVIGVRRI